MTALRKARALAHRQKDIIDAACRAFARRGYQAASMQDIAKEAGYTAASLYTYFPSKQHIVDALAELLAEEVLETFEQPIPAGLDLRQRLELLLSRQLALALNRRDAFAAFFMLRTGAEPLERQRHSGPPVPGFQLYCEHLALFMAEQAQPGELCGREPELAAYAFAGLAQALFLRWLWGDPKRPPNEDVELLLDLFFHGLRGAGATERRSAATRRTSTPRRALRAKPRALARAERTGVTR